MGWSGIPMLLNRSFICQVVYSYSIIYSYLEIPSVLPTCFADEVGLIPPLWDTHMVPTLTGRADEARKRKTNIICWAGKANTLRKKDKKVTFFKLVGE